MRESRPKSATTSLSCQEAVHLLGALSDHDPSATVVRLMEPEIQYLPQPVPAKSFWGDFRQFLKDYSVIGMAIGIVMGTAVNRLIQTIVDGLITPLINLIVPSKDFQALILTVRGVEFRFGDVISALIQFIIVALLIFFTVKYLLRKDELLKK